MKRWWCMDCRTEVELNKHGRCGCCDSEAVDSSEPKVDVTGLDSMAKMAAAGTSVSA
jgi:hypothetical protein